MFETLRWIACRAGRITAPQDQAFRKLKTRRGDYFVRWAPAPVSALIRSERLVAAELVMDDPADRHRLIRELFLLGFGDEMGGGTAPSTSPISRLARDLMERR